MINNDEIGEKLRANICYCIGNVCYYCRANLYCNNDHSGCCSTPNSVNQCGRFCVPPEHTCCNNKGACQNDYPTCCDEYCCKQNSKCCGKDCCSKESKCCKNNQDKIFCISRLPTTIDPVHDYCTKDNCIKSPEMDEMLEYFSNMCNIFAVGTRARCITKDPTKTCDQFAVLTLNKASEAQSSNTYEPLPIEYDITKQNGNYASAPPTINGDVIEHSEKIILKDIEKRIKWFREYRPNSQPIPPTIYLFTFLSPCIECLKSIIEHDKKVANMIIGWQVTYDKLNQSDFLNGIRDLMKNEITFVYSIDKNTCNFNDKIKRKPLVQPTLLEYLVSKVNNVEFCETEMALRSSFIKLINWLVWNCKDYFRPDGSKKSKDKDNVINCMVKMIQNINPEVNPCMNLPDLIKNSMNSLHQQEDGRFLLLSPPLDPQSQTDSISNNYNDLTGEYGNPFLCFQVKY